MLEEDDEAGVRSSKSFRRESRPWDPSMRRSSSMNSSPISMINRDEHHKKQRASLMEMFDEDEILDLQNLAVEKEKKFDTIREESKVNSEASKSTDSEK